VCPTCRTSLLTAREQGQVQTNGGALAQPDGEDSSDGESDESDLSDADSDGDTTDDAEPHVLRAVAWESAGENDVEGLDESEDEEELVVVPRHR
jgi:hypothetical protein